MELGRLKIDDERGTDRKLDRNIEKEIGLYTAERERSDRCPALL